MPITPIAGAWQKYLIRVGSEIAGAVAGYLLTGLSEGTSDETLANAQWRRAQIIYTRDTPTGTTEDRALFTLDLVNLTSGAIDPTWTPADYTAVQAALTTLVTALRPQQAPNHRWVQCRYYRMGFNPPGWPSKPFQESGAPEFVHNPAIVPATGAGYLPYQAAMTVTERTHFPGHWGRMYVPGPQGGSLDNFGRFSTVNRDAVRTAFATCFATLRTSEFFPVVPMTQHNKQPAFGLLSVESISVDDIPDVQRRRRPREVAGRSVSP